MDVVGSELAHRDPTYTGNITKEQFESLLSSICPEISLELIRTIVGMFVNWHNGLVQYQHFVQMLNESSLNLVYQTGNNLNHLLKHDDHSQCLCPQLPPLVSPHPQHGLPGARAVLQKKVWHKLHWLPLSMESTCTTSWWLVIHRSPSVAEKLDSFTQSIPGPRHYRQWQDQSGRLPPHPSTVWYTPEQRGVFSSAWDHGPSAHRSTGLPSIFTNVSVRWTVATLPCH